MATPQSPARFGGLASSRAGLHARRWWRSPLAWAALLIPWLGLGLLLRVQTDRYLAFQADGVQGLQVFDDLLTPVAGGLALLLWFCAPLAALPGETLLRGQQLWPMWALGRGGPARLARESFLMALLWQAVPMLLALALLAVVLPVRPEAMAAVASGLFLLLLLAQALISLLSRFIHGRVALLAGGWALLLLLATLEVLALPQAPLQLFAPFRDGLWPLAGLLALPLYALGVLLVALGWPACAGRRARLLLALAALLLISAGALLANRAERFGTAAGTTLTVAQREWLATAPLARVEVISADEATQRDVLAALTPLRAARPDLQLAARHPAALAPQWRDALQNRELLWVELDGRVDLIALPISEPAQAVLRAWQALVERRDAWLVFLEGQGERELFGQQARDLQGLRELLKQDGYPLVPLNFASGAPLPDNARALVIASPARAPDAATQARIRAWLARGGHLLWLREPDEPAGWEWLEQGLGLQRQPGVVLDRAGLRRGTPHAAIALVERFPPHPALNGVQQLIALPWAAALKPLPGSDFRATPLLTGSVDSVISADAETDDGRPSDGPQVYAYALERSLVLRGERVQQRVIVIGDGHFLADTALGNYGNAALARALLRWLATPDSAALQSTAATAQQSWLPSVPVRDLLRWGWLLLPLPLLLLRLWQALRRRGG